MRHHALAKRIDVLRTAVVVPVVEERAGDAAHAFEVLGGPSVRIEWCHEVIHLNQP